MSRRQVDMKDQTCGELFVIEQTGKRSIKGDVIWRCRCSCGAEKEATGSSLRTGRLKSCGHLAVTHRAGYGEWAKRYWSGRKRTGARGPADRG